MEEIKRQFDRKKIPLKTWITMPILKAFRFPIIPSRPKTGKFYRLPLQGCVSANGDITHGSIRIGTENKVIVTLQGGGVSWNEYMAARPNSMYAEPLEQNFYASESELIADIVTGHGITSKKEDNPFRNWSVISITYNTGDFHIGTNNFSYTNLEGKNAVLYHHGYKNYQAVMKEALKWIGNTPEQLLVTGFSAGGFGAALLADDIMHFFPKCNNVICCPDSCFMLYDGWREAAEKVWKAPREIYERLHSDNITLDSLVALKKKYGSKVKILFSCSTRDVELSKFWNYIKCGKLYTDKETGIRFQDDLRMMCKQLREQIPDAGIYIFNTPVTGKGMEELKEAGLTVHCIGLSSAAETLRVDGKTVVEWVWNAVNGEPECIGMGLLDNK